MAAKSIKRKPLRSKSKASAANEGTGLRGMLLDARRDRLDLRDLPYRPPLLSLPDSYPSTADLKRYLKSYIKQNLVLDQGQEGACTGFGLACVVNYLLWTKHLRGDGGVAGRVSPRMLYHLARTYDEWPGEDYEGSSCRGALKGWHKHGVCGDALWPYYDANGNAAFVPPKAGWESDALKRTLGVYYRVDKNSVVEMQSAILDIGALYVSADVHRGWEIKPVSGDPSFDKLPVIKMPAKKAVAGGHAFALVGYDDRGFVVQNSWGPGWGLGGFALLTYEDWADYGYDAWACALGVPKRMAQGMTEAPKVRVSSRSQMALRRMGNVSMMAAETVKDTAGVWSEEQAYLRTVVFGNDGYVQKRVVFHKDEADTVAKLGNDIPNDWFDKNGGGTGDADHLVLYAHGGLNAESGSIARIRALGKCFEDNGVYPLFLTWRTGVKDSIQYLIEDKLDQFAGPAGALTDWLEQLKDSAIEAKDRAIEAASRALLVRAIWTQMKQNAAGAAASDGGGRLLAKALATLAERRKGRLQIHLVGHSAGAIILGHLLPHLPACVSCTLYAPACTVDFAVRHYVAAVNEDKIKGNRFAVHVLSDERERADAVGPYGKSLLYLVSRALEDVHKTAILGLHRSFLPAFNSKDKKQWNDGSPELLAESTAGLKEWQKFWDSLPGDAAKRLIVEEQASVSTGSDPDAPSLPAVHGCFDNHAGVVTATLRRILQKAPEIPPRNLDY